MSMVKLFGLCRTELNNLVGLHIGGLNVGVALYMCTPFKYMLLSMVLDVVVLYIVVYHNS